MPEDFYRPFDREYLRDETNRARTEDYRSVFHQDRDRVMFTTAFRRLQAKTQVFQAGEYDFYRTRLTHSLEVANIAKSIVVWLRQATPEAAIDPDLLEAICLAHDIGHPPFGHAGERVLNALMEKFGGFEGNAQTLRILTRTIYSYADGRREGMSPSRALLDGVLKYKESHRDSATKKNHFIYGDQVAVLDFCFGTPDLRKMLGDVAPNDFHSLECQVMDHADDVAYSCFDLVDGAKARFLSPSKIESWAATAKLDDKQGRWTRELMEMLGNGKLQAKMNQTVGELIRGAALCPAQNFMSERTQRHAWRLEVTPEAEGRIRLYKALSRDLVFGSSALQQIEFKGAQILRTLTEALFENYLSPVEKPKVLLPDEFHRAVCDRSSEAARARLICDHLAGMTDAYALRSYKRLFDPDYGSISELI